MAKRRLNSLTDLKRFLADVIHRTDSGALDPSIGGKLTYMVNVMRNLVVQEDLEVRLKLIEERLDEKSK